MRERQWIAVGAFNLLVAIGAGAFGAHALKTLLSSEMLAIWQTAVQYQMVHGLGILALAHLATRWQTTVMRWSLRFMLLGIVFFSGSLYVLALTGIRVLGAITPIGGLAFLAAWLLVIWNALRTAE
ncbi:DUF423 domain-containing protein [Undibacterium fentianense]|uniref:DUF423 domain-containing protein n=1 Tax=Undibacterium fentianense TaxID=2828728 RepID=A0A941E5N9_9BURK|nr:DUF423 domain-containing protein [Undibacterium fentianense]MBR7801416.1 DUF423 domain-containing protein [Undibacterium fentianense]